MCYKLTIESTSPVPPQTKISRWNPVRKNHPESTCYAHLNMWTNKIVKMTKVFYCVSVKCVKVEVD